MEHLALYFELLAWMPLWAHDSHTMIAIWPSEEAYIDRPQGI